MLLNIKYLTELLFKSNISHSRCLLRNSPSLLLVHATCFERATADPVV